MAGIQFSLPQPSEQRTNFEITPVNTVGKRQRAVGGGGRCGSGEARWKGPAAAGAGWQIALAKRRTVSLFRSSPMSAPRSTLSAIARASAFTGTLDIGAAVLQYLWVGGREPIRVFWYISSAAVGRDAAMAGGLLTGGFGLLFHYLIAGIWTAAFFAAYPRVRWLGRHRTLAGIGYGALVWLVMNLIVVPLSRAPKLPVTILGDLVGIAILVVCLGLPVSILAHQHFAGRTR